jgi:LysM repeat protein
VRGCSILLVVALIAIPWLATPLVASADSGYATWYGPGFQGHVMADGQTYDMYDPTTTACNIYPFGTWIKVTNPVNSRSVTVQVRDRGGFHHAFDLSYAAFRLLADPAVMEIPVTYQIVAGPNAAAAAPARAAVPSSSATRPATYVVQPGDSLSGIAAQFGLGDAALAAWNSITDPNLIAAGEMLRLTPPSSAPAAPTSSRTYVVQAGDTVYGIASQFGIGADRLVTANRLSDPTDLQIGQTLTLPPTGSTPASATYIVQDGDTISGIAQRFGVSVGEILFVNQLDDPDHIAQGLSLTIPGT